MAALSAYVHEAIRSLATNPKAAAATFTGGAGAYAGLTATSYNKENFMIDQGNRFGRFTTARANMVAQVGQYRFDIRGMTNITITKAHVFLDTAQLFMCTCAALTCAGRVGMHGAAPPGWLLALYTGNIFIGAMYLTVCMWLGFHATLRAQCGMVSLLTRKVRLPIPSLSQINNSRQFGSTYEKQRWGDILRFPWVPHPYDNPEIPGASSEEEDVDPTDKSEGKKGKGKREGKPEGRAGDYAASEAFGSTGRASVPSWIHDEQIVDKGQASVPRHEPQFQGDLQLNDSNDPHDAPDHFKLFTEAQKEWFPYETYHRIALLYGVCCFFHAVCYYCVITAMAELRGFWIAWALPAVFMTAQYWILQLDIFKAQGQQMLRGFELFGQVAPYFATAACTCEYRFMYSKAQVGLAWTFAMAALASHLLFACRFYDLMTPDTLSNEMEDKDGKSWWPKKWSVPLAFANTTFQLTPPKKLKKGQHDLLHEAVNLERQHGGVCKVRRRRGKDSLGKKRTKRATPQSSRELTQQANDLEDRFRSVWQHVVGKDQISLNQLYGRWHSANKEAQALNIGGDASGSGSDTGSSSDGIKGKMGNSQYNAEKIVGVADELNLIEDALAELEQKHQVTADPASMTGTTGIESGTSTRELPQTPYWIMRAAVGTHIFIWVFIMCCTTAEIIMGPDSLFMPPGEPPWIRNQKLRPYQPDKSYLHLSTDPLPDWYRLFVAAEIPDPSAHGDDTSGSHRRLNSASEADAFSDLFSTLPALDWLADKIIKEDSQPAWQTGMEAQQAGAGTRGMPTTMAAHAHAALETTSVPMGGFMTPSLKALPVQWPPLFEPRHLACQTRASGTVIAALTPRGFGALVHMKNSSNMLQDGHGLKSLAAEQFALSGISDLGPLVGASWGTSGLHLVTKAGHLLHCPGHSPTDGAWPCRAHAGAPVPMSTGATLRAGAIIEHALTGHTLALLFEDMPTTVVLYRSDSDGESWRPAGEMHLPPNSGRASLGFGSNAVMVVTEDGAVHHRPLHEKAPPSFLPAPASSVTREWHAACTATDEGSILRLALRQGGPHMSAPWRPELVVATKMHNVPTPLVNV